MGFARFCDCALFRAVYGARADLLGYPRVAEDPKPERLPEAPRLPERAAIYIAPDGSVHFGALFEGLLPVARSLGSPRAPPAGILSGGSDKEPDR